MVDLEIRLLFNQYTGQKISVRNDLKKTSDKKTKVKLKKDIKRIDKLQLELIEQYIEEVGSDLPLEMQCYFTGEKLYTDKNEILYNWAVAYNHGEE